jgi:hypothetical protein
VATAADDQQLRALTGLHELAGGAALADNFAHRHQRLGAEDFFQRGVQVRSGLLTGWQERAAGRS